MAPRSSFTDSPDYIQSLDRGLQVLRAFNRDRPRCTLSEIAAHIGLSRAVARRSLLTLQHLGYVAAQGRHFFLTPRILELGYSYLSSLDLTELAHEAMEQLSQRAGESCSMAVLDGSEIVYVARVAVRRARTGAGTLLHRCVSPFRYGRGRVRSERQHALQRRRESDGAEKNVARFASRAAGD